MSQGTLGGTSERVISWRALVVYLVLLTAGIGLQSSMAVHLNFLGAQPDFLLTLALCVALLTDASIGAGAGFISGLVTAAIAGPTLGTFLITRIVAAWAVGALRRRFVRVGIGVTLLGVGAGSVLAGVLYGFSNPRIGLAHWLSLTFVGAVMNLLVALPLAVLARWKTVRL